MDQYFDPDEMPEGFFAKEAEGLDQEVTDLRRIWTQFVHDQCNTATGNVHNPPSLFVAATNIAAGSLMSHMLFQDEEVRDEFLSSVAYFGATMFRFGQFSDQRGVLAANLEQCRCGQLSDSDIASFLKDKK